MTGRLPSRTFAGSFTNGCAAEGLGRGGFAFTQLSAGLWGQAPQYQILPHPACVTLYQSLNFSEPQVLIWKVQGTMASSHWLFGGAGRPDVSGALPFCYMCNVSLNPYLRKIEVQTPSRFPARRWKSRDVDSALLFGMEAKKGLRRAIASTPPHTAPTPASTLPAPPPPPTAVTALDTAVSAASKWQFTGNQSTVLPWSTATCLRPSLVSTCSAHTQASRDHLVAQPRDGRSGPVHPLT